MCSYTNWDSGEETDTSKPYIYVQNGLWSSTDKKTKDRFGICKRPASTSQAMRGLCVRCMYLPEDRNATGGVLVPSPLQVLVAACATEIQLQGSGLSQLVDVTITATTGTSPTVSTTIVHSESSATAFTGALSTSLVGATLFAELSTDGITAGDPVPVATVAASPTVSSSTAQVSIGATILSVLGTNFVGTCSVLLSATSGTVTQPTSVSVLASTELQVVVDPLNADLAEHSLQAVVSCNSATTCASAVTIATVSASDTSPPTFPSGYPSVASTTDSSITISMQLNEPGSVFAVVVADGANSPSAAQVAAAQDGSGASALASGNTVVAAHFTTVSLELGTDLSASSAYDVWIVAQDDEPTPNRQATAVKLDATTASDATAPEFASGYPSASSTDSTVTVSILMNEPGTAYIVVVADGGTAPTASEVKLATAPSQVAAVSVADTGPSPSVVTGGLTGLEASTAYDVYVLLVDEANNVQSTPTKLDSTTLSDATPPQYGAGYPRVSSVSDSSATVEVALDEPGSAFFVVLPNDAAAPTSAQVKAGTDGSGTPAVFAASVAVAASSTAVSAVATGLPASTALDVWFVAQDDHSTPNVQAEPVRVDTATTSDATAPEFVSGFPVATSVADSTAICRVQLNEPGSFYYVVLPDGSSEPSASQVVSGSVVGAVASGSAAVSASDTTTDASVAGLSHSTDYDMWVVAQDDEATPNVQAAASRLDFTTVADATAPTMVTGFPRAVSITDSSFTIEVQSSEAGLFYAVVLVDGAAAPTSAQVKSGLDAAGSSALASTNAVSITAASTTATATVASLAASTAYDVYIVAEDGSANLQASPVLVDVTTLLDATPPTFVSGFPSVSSITDSSFLLQVQLNEPGTAFLVVVADGASEPTAAQVVAGTDATGSTAVATGSVVVPTAATTTSFTVSTGLDHSTAYDVYVVAQDGMGSPNVQAAATLIDVTTTADVTAPSFVTGYPKAVDTTSSSMTLEVQMNEPGSVAYVVLANNAATPSSAQVVAGTDGSGSAAIASDTISVASGSTTSSSTVSSGITTATTYDVWFVASDDEVTPNQQASPTKVQVTAEADSTAPSFVSGYPTTSSVGDSSFVIEVQLDEAGLFFYAVLLDGATEPSVAQLQAGTDGAGSVALAAGSIVVGGASATSQVLVEGMTAATGFDVYVTAQDDEAVPNTQTSTTKVDVTTGADVTPPTITTSYPKATTLTDSGFTVEMSQNEPGSWTYVVLLHGATTPTTANVKAGVDGSGASSLASGTVTVAAAESVTSAAITGLDAATVYNVFIVATDDEPTPNDNSVVQLSVVTSADATPPSFETGSPSMSSVDYTGAAIQAALDEPGRWFWVIVASGASTPSVAQVLAGQNAGGAAAVAAGSATAETSATVVTSVVSTTLTPVTEYSVFAVAQDDQAPTPNVQSTVSLVQFNTSSDTTAPVFASGFPRMSSVSDSGLDVEVDLDEAGTVFWVLLPNAASTPTVAAVEAGTDGSGAAAIAFGSVALTTPGVPVTASVPSGLDAATSYDVYLMAKDTLLNVQASAVRLDVSTLSDATPPEFVTTFPSVADIADFSFTLQVQLNEPGACFFAVLPSGSLVPTVASVIAGTASSSVASGSFVVASPDTTTSVAVESGLLASTTYDVYVAIRDNQPVPNVQPTLGTVEVSTLPDTTPPQWVGVFPRVSSVLDVSFVIDAQLDEPGQFYYVVVTSGTTAPTAADVQAGTDGVGQPVTSSGVAAVPSAVTTTSATVSGLLALTDYTVYLVAEDDEATPSQQSTPVSLVLRTISDISPPGFVALYPSVSDATDQQVTVNIQLDEPGNAFVVALLAGSASPSSIQVRTGLNGASISVSTAGSAAVITASTTTSITIAGLESGTAYDVWIVAQDDEVTANLQVSPTKVTTTTLPDQSPPEWLSGYPLLVDVRDSALAIQVQVNEAANWFYVVLVSSAEAPSASEVRAGTDGNGGAPVAAGSQTASAGEVSTTQVTSGLTASTAYTVWIVAEDLSGPNLMPSAVSLATTTSEDATPPQFATDFPASSSVLDFSFSLDLKLNEAGTVYWVVLVAGRPAPSVAQIVAGVDGTGTSGAASGTSSVPTADTLVSVPVSSGLGAGTSYDVWAAAEDTMSPTPNIHLSGTLLEVTTAADATAPVTESGYPAVSGITDSTVTVELQLDEPGFFDYVVVPSTARLPSVAEVLGGTDGDGIAAVAIGTSVTVVLAQSTASSLVSGLAAVTSYTVYTVARDTSGNQQTSVGFVTTTTLSDTTPPSWETGYPIVNSPTDSSASVGVIMNEAGTWFWSVVAFGASTPTSTQVMSGLDGSGSSAIAAGNSTAAGLASSVATVQSVLAASTNYDVWFVAQDDEPTPNVQASATKVSFVTAADSTPPVFETGYPVVSSVADFSIAVSVQLSEPGRWYWAVLVDGAAGPSVAQVVAGTDGVDSAAVASGVTAVAVAKTTVSTVITSNLKASTAYDVWIVAEDDEATPNRQVSSVSISTSTIADQTPPVFVSTYPKASTVTDSGFALQVQMDEAGLATFIVVLDGATPPSAAQVLAGVDGSAASALVSGTVSVATASATASEQVVGLSAATAYDVWVVAQDDEATPNKQTTPTRVDVTSAADATPPTFPTSYPAAASPTDSSFVLSVQLNEPGSVAYVVLQDTATAPSSAQVVAGTDGSAGAAVVTGSALVASADTTVSVTVGSGVLSASTTYHVWVVGRDDEATPNVQAVPVKLIVTTTADVTAPSFITSYPSSSSVLDFSFNVNVQLNEAGTAYVVVLADGGSTPSSAQVKAGTDGTSTAALFSASVAVSAASTTATVSVISGVAAATAYDVWIVVQDDESPTPNVQSSPTRLDVTTSSDATPPTWQPLFPRIVNVGDETMTLEVQADEPGTWFWVLLADGTNAPSSTQVVAGTDGSGGSPIAASSGAILAATTTASHLINTGLTASTNYDVWFVCRDDESTPNLQATAVKVDVVTVVDSSAPTFETGYPQSANVADTSFSVVVQMDEPGTVFWLLLTDGASSPSVSEIKNGTIGLASGSLTVVAAATSVSASLSGLTDSTAYDVWVVGEDDEPTPNTQASVVKLDVSTASDQTPPLFSTGFPRSVSITDVQFTIEVQGNEAGSFFFVVVDNEAAAPTASQVLAGHNSANVAALGSGSGTIASGITASALLSGFVLPSTGYDVWVVLRDEASNAQVAPTKVDVFTSEDATAPVWTSSYPAVASTQDTAVNIAVNLDEASHAYAVVVANAATTPSVAQIMAGQDGTGAAAVSSTSVAVGGGNAVYGLVLVGLTPVTQYDVWVVAEDIHTPTSNKQATGTKLDITTASDTSPPLFSDGYPKTSSVQDFSFSVEVSMSEAGAWYWVVLANGTSPNPSAAEVKAGTGPGGSTPISHGSGSVFASNSMVSMQVSSGLSAATAYHVFVVAQDSASNLQAASTRTDVVTGADVTPPTFISSYPSVASVTDTTASVNVQLSEAGSVSWVVQASGGSTPSVAMVASGLDGSGSTAIVSGLSLLPSPSSTVAVLCSTLTSATAYEFWVVARDDEPTPNTQAVATKVVFTTATDASPPSFTSGYPKVANIRDTGFTVVGSIDEAGVIYAIVLTDGATQPSPNQVRSGLDASNSAALASSSTTAGASGVEVTSAVSTGVIAATDYDVWVVAEDDSTPANVQTSATLINVTTAADATPPTFLSGYPKAGTVADETFSVEVQLNEAGAVHYVVLGDGESSPSVAEVKAGTNGNGGSGKTFGSVNVSAASTTTLISVTDAGIEAATHYDVWIVAQDDEPTPNIQAAPVRVDISTAADATPPAFPSGYPTGVDVHDFDLSIAVQLSEPGTWYWILLASTASPPSSVQVKAGTDGSGTAAIASDSGTIGFAFTTVTASVTSGVIANTTYFIYATAEDDEPTPNVMAAPVLANVTTGPDVTPPVTSSGFPNIPALLIEDFAFTVEMKIDEPGTAYVAAPCWCDVLCYWFVLTFPQ